MTNTSRLAFRFASGAVLGVGGGVIAAELVVPGIVLLLLAGVSCARVPPRFAQLAGFLIAAGALWGFFGIRLMGTCTAQPATCSGPPVEPFVFAALIVLAGGIIAAWETARRSRLARGIDGR